MKKIILLLLGVILFTLNACKKEAINQHSSEVASILQLLKVDNSRTISFASTEDLELACLKTRALSLEDHNKLFIYLKQQGVQTMEGLTVEISKEYAEVDTKESYDSFIKKNEGKITITKDSSIEVKDYVPRYAEFLNLDGEIRVGGRLEKHTPSFTIVIADGSYAKLEKALRNMLPNLTDGILIKYYVADNSILPTYAKSLKCGTEVNGQGGASLNRVTYSCHVGSPQSFRLKNTFSVRRQEVWRTAVCPDGPTIQNYITCQIESHKRGFLGYWYRHRTPITWGIGWGVQGDPAITPYNAGGTGWTTSSSQHQFYWERKIDYDPCIPFGVSFSRYKYLFDYIYTNASTAEISDCSYGCQ